MLHRLFNSSAPRHSSSEADLKSHLLLHGNQRWAQPNRDVEQDADSSSEAGLNLGGHNVRLVIAQDLGEKAKVVLFDTQRSSPHKEPPSEPCPLHKFSTNHVSRGAATASSSRPSSSAELITELMFGTVPLSYRGTSVRVHPLPNIDGDGKRSFLFTKVFTVNIADTIGSASSTTTTSGTASLSSSYGSTSAMREYPFPAMTPITDEVCQPSRNLAADRSTRDRGRDRVPSINATARTTTSNTAGASSRKHQRVPSNGSRAETADAAPYVPFTKTQPAQSHDDYFSGWLPSPGPTLTRRRRSIDTIPGTPPGSYHSMQHSRYQAAMCAIGVIFSVPGDGHEETECALMTRYWQMITRATYALQRVIYDEIELALNIITAHGTLQTPRSRARVTKGEAQVYQRGKKCYVALGHNCLSSNHNVSTAVESFKTRLVGGINLPEIVQKPLQQEADILVDELTWMIDCLDRKESKFMFSMLMSFMVDFTATIRNELTPKSSMQKNSLQNRLVIVSDDAVLARRMIFCIARLFFRDYNEHYDSVVDYSLVWPSCGMLSVPRKDLLRRRQSSLAKAPRLHHGWDIPRHGRPLSSGSYNMPPLSPSIYHRPPSTVSNGSSRASSWKPAWSWFANGSKTHLGEDASRSVTSDTKTLLTSWNSADFPIDRSPRTRSPRSWSPHHRSDSQSPKDPNEDAATDDDEDVASDPTLQTLEVPSRKNPDGTIEVDCLATIPIMPDCLATQMPQLDQAHSGFPLTGVLSKFHPDMLLQAIPYEACVEGQLKSYLSEEDLYIQENAGREDCWLPMATMVIAELGHAWRLRRLTRLTRTLPRSKVENALAAAAAAAVDQSSSTGPVYENEEEEEETWQDEQVTEIKEDLVASITGAVQEYRQTRNTRTIQTLIDSLPFYAAAAAAATAATAATASPVNPQSHV